MFMNSACSQVVKWDTFDKGVLENESFTFRGTVGCDKFTWARSKTPLRRNSKFIVNWTGTPCFGSIGLVTDSFNGSNVRMGTDNNSWGVRTYGPHSSGQHTGAWHNNNFTAIEYSGKKEMTIVLLGNGNLEFYSDNKLIHTFYNLPSVNLFPCAFVCCGNSTLTAVH